MSHFTGGKGQKGETGEAGVPGRDGRDGADIFVPDAMPEETLERILNTTMTATLGAMKKGS